MLLGAIADDLAGANALAIALSQAGMRTALSLGVPPARAALPLSDYDAVVTALDTRAAGLDEAVSGSLACAEVLREAGAHQLYVAGARHSGATGNIGPVCEALLDFLRCPVALAVPADPARGLTVYQGHMFAGENPEGDLAEALKRHCGLRSGHIGYATVDAGPRAIIEALRKAADAGGGLMVADALCDRHLIDIALAADGMPLVCGSSAAASGLATNFIRSGQLDAVPAPERMPAPPGRKIILAATAGGNGRSQTDAARNAGYPFRQAGSNSGEEIVAELCAWASAQAPGHPCLIELPENGALAGPLAQQLAAGGFSRIIVAGDGLACAAARSLDAGILDVGPRIAPGAVWTRCARGRDLALALLPSGTGAPDSLVAAWALLEDPDR